MSESELKIYSDGSKRWFLNGLLHRKDGPSIIYPHGTKEWYLNGLLHREDGPSVIYSHGTKIWYLNGVLHREDGPVVIYPGGAKEWWLNDKRLSFGEYKSWFIKKISNPSYKLTDGDISFIKEYLK